MKYEKELHFNEFHIPGWRCSCGEVYYDPEHAQKILLLNKLQKEALRAKLGRIRSNLVLRVPRQIEKALNLKKGEVVRLEMNGRQFTVVPDS